MGRGVWEVRAESVERLFRRRRMMFACFGVRCGPPVRWLSTQHPTSNARHPMAQARSGGGFLYWMFGVGCWVLDVLSRKKNAVPVLLLSGVIAYAEDLPDISTVAPDLTVPEMTTGAPEAGKRVRFTTPGWEGTEVYGALYLPVDWKPERRFPVIVEWAGNGDFHNAFGDVSTGKVEASRLGYGITAGEHRLLGWVPSLHYPGAADGIKWGGGPPEDAAEPTPALCRPAPRRVVEKIG